MSSDLQNLKDLDLSDSSPIINKQNSKSVSSVETHQRTHGPTPSFIFTYKNHGPTEEYKKTLGPTEEFKKTLGPTEEFKKTLGPTEENFETLNPSPSIFDYQTLGPTPTYFINQEYTSHLPTHGTTIDKTSNEVTIIAASVTISVLFLAVIGYFFIRPMFYKPSPV